MCHVHMRQTCLLQSGGRVLYGSWVKFNFLYFFFLSPYSVSYKETALSKSPTVIVNLPVPIFNSISFCLIYFEVVLSRYTFGLSCLPVDLLLISLYKAHLYVSLA